MLGDKESENEQFLAHIEKDFSQVGVWKSVERQPAICYFKNFERGEDGEDFEIHFKSA